MMRWLQDCGKGKGMEAIGLYGTEGIFRFGNLMVQIFKFIQLERVQGVGVENL